MCWCCLSAPYPALGPSVLGTGLSKFSRDFHALTDFSWENGNVLLSFTPFDRQLTVERRFCKHLCSSSFSKSIATAVQGRKPMKQKKKKKKSTTGNAPGKWFSCHMVCPDSVCLSCKNYYPDEWQLFLFFWLRPGWYCSPESHGERERFPSLTHSAQAFDSSGCRMRSRASSRVSHPFNLIGAFPSFLKKK